MSRISQATIDDILKGVHVCWHDWMKMMMDQKPFETILERVIADRHRLAPEAYNIFRVMKMSPSAPKVIIIGQDPYINGEAHGLAFSSRKGLTPSLREIFKEIAETEGKLRLNPNLEDWEAQDVFLINTNLTTILKKSLAHEEIGWRWFTGALLEKVSRDVKHPLVILAWGSHAKNMAKSHIHKQENRLFLEHTHPAARFQEFTGNNHFRKANKWFRDAGMLEIDWAGKDFNPVLRPDSTTNE